MDTITGRGFSGSCLVTRRRPTRPCLTGAVHRNSSYRTAARGNWIKFPPSFWVSWIDPPSRHNVYQATRLPTRKAEPAQFRQRIHHLGKPSVRHLSPRATRLGWLGCESVQILRRSRPVLWILSQLPSCSRYRSHCFKTAVNYWANSISRIGLFTQPPGVRNRFLKRRAVRAGNPARSRMTFVLVFWIASRKRAFNRTDRGLLRSVLGPWTPVPKCEAPGASISVEEHTSMAPRPAAKVRILRFKNLQPFRHYRGLQGHV